MFQPSGELHVCPQQEGNQGTGVRRCLGLTPGCGTQPVFPRGWELVAEVQLPQELPGRGGSPVNP